LSVIIGCHPDSALCISLGAGISKGLADHLDKRPFVNSNILAAGTLYLVISGCKGIFFDNSCFMTTENFTGAYFIIFPQFFFAGGTTNDQHN
jgi:hypothetical protein